jgi:hypothetical protein
MDNFLLCSINFGCPINFECPSMSAISLVFATWWNFGWGSRDHQKCQCCQHICEDKAHLLTCPKAYYTEKWNETMWRLEEWPHEMEMAPASCHCIICALSLAMPVALAQGQIGWMHFTDKKIPNAGKGSKQLIILWLGLNVLQANGSPG